MHSFLSKFTTILHFLVVLLVTVLTWVFTGKLAQLLFPYLPILAFLMVGLVAGLVLALLLPGIHQEPDQNPASSQGHFMA